MLAPGSSSPWLVVIAASAGSLQALFDVLAPLPADFPAAIAIVKHRGLQEPERLVALLGGKTRLRVCHAQEGAALEAGTVYVCPPGMHMTTEHCVRLLHGPRLEYVRPNADLMFESVGKAYGHRAIGVVLSGCGSDAARGSLAMARAGATVLAQHEDTCAFPGMPRAAVQLGAVERVGTPLEIAELLSHWQRASARAASEPPSSLPSRSLPGAQEGLRIVLVDDHQIVLEGLRVLLEGERDMFVLAAVGDGEAGVRSALTLSPHVVVMDLRMPELDGVQAIRRIVSRQPLIKIVVLSAEGDAGLIEQALRAGATGYVSKERAFSELVRAIRTVTQGEMYLPEMARARAAALRTRPSPQLPEQG